MNEKSYIDYNNKKIDLESLSLEQLKKLNLQEEMYFAENIKKLPPFSREREEYSKYANQKIFQIAEVKNAKDETRKDKKSFGTTDHTLEFIGKIIKKLQKRKKEIVYFEAGVGTGYALEKILQLPKVRIIGCDVFLSKRVKEICEANPNIDIEEKDLYHKLIELEDDSIDLFYADNVLEHIVEDEYEKTCKEIAKKLKKQGMIVLIIPNAYIGPNDVTKYFFPMGTKAKGFHFMEQTFKENMEVYKKCGLKTKYIAWKNRKKEINIIKNYFMIEKLKMKLEKSLSKIENTKMRARIFRGLGYEIYVLTKK